MLFKKIYGFGDKLEDVVRGKLSHYPLVYAFVGGIGIIVFWRGVWHTTDYLMGRLLAIGGGDSTTDLVSAAWWDGPLSVLIGMVLLLAVGLFVSSFIGNEIIISGLKREKKMIEKTEDEVGAELDEDKAIKREIHEMGSRLKRIEEVLKNRPNA